MMNINIGDRIKWKSKFKGTVKFIGEINNSKGTFYGIELDTPDGKSNGCVNNVCYFTCKENYGIFVTASLLKKIIEDESSFIDVSIDNNSEKKKEENQIMKGNSKTNAEFSESKVDLTEDIKISNSLSIDPASLPEVDNSDKENHLLQKSNLPVFNLSTKLKQSNHRYSTLSSSSITKKYPRRSLYSNVPIICKPKEQSITEKIISSDTKDQNLLKISDTGEKYKNEVENITKESISKITCFNWPLKNVESCQKCHELKIDCEEKVETFKILRKIDKDKVLILEKDKQELITRLSEVTSIIESIKKEKESINREYNNYRETMRSVEENIEMMAMDKEMAEGNLELCQTEINELKQKLLEKNYESERNQENNLYKDDCPILMKYKNAIIELSNNINNLKESNESKDMELEIYLEKQILLEMDVVRLEVENQKMKEDIDKMKEFIDSTSDAVEIVDNLSEKNEKLEMKVTNLEGIVQQLDEGKDILLQKMENRITEVKDLRNDNMILTHNVESLKKELSSYDDKLKESEDLTDKFKEKIQTLQKDISTLKSELNSKSYLVSTSRNVDRRFSIMPGVQKHSIYSETSKIIEFKLKDLELKQKITLANTLERYLVDNFNNFVDVKDLTNVMLLLERYSEKIAIVLGHIDEKKKLVSDCFFNKIETKSFHKKLEFLLLNWQDLLNHLKINFYHSNVDLVKVFKKHMDELKSHERVIDLIISWIQKDSFDESRNLENVNISIEYFRGFMNENFPSQIIECDLRIKYFVKIINTGSICLENYIKLILPFNDSKTNENLRFKNLLESLNEFIIEVQKKSKGMYKHLVHLSKINLSPELLNAINDTIIFMNQLVQSLSQFYDEIAADKISVDCVMQGLFNILSGYFEQSNNESLKNLFFIKSYIKDTINQVENSLENGLFENIVVSKQKFETIIDKSVRCYLERWSHLQQLPSNIMQKEKHIETLIVRLSEQSQKLDEAQLSINYAKIKMIKGIQESAEQMDSLNTEIKEVKQENKSKDCTIVTLNSQIFDLIQQINEFGTSPVDIVTSERNDINNKEGLVTYIRLLKDILESLTHKLSAYKASHSRAMLKKLKPLNVLPSKKICTNVENFMEKSEALSYDIFKTLSSIKIPSLSRNMSQDYKDSEICFKLLKNKSDKIKKECAVSSIMNVA